jgi:hypothetical protein
VPSRSRRRLSVMAAILVAGCEGAPARPTDQATPPLPTTTTTTLPAASQGCRLPSSRRDFCHYNNSTFVPDVERAIARVQRELPEMFDFAQSNGGLSFRVLDVPRYHHAVVQALRDTGLCAIFDGEEVAVKSSNDFSDQYDIITAADFVRWGDGAYAATCQPAAF